MSTVMITKILITEDLLVVIAAHVIERAVLEEETIMHPQHLLAVFST
jgi:hypothetical protein